MSDSKVKTGALPVGTIVHSSSDRYLVEEVLGAGGFGITYKVLRLSDRIFVALKEYFPDVICERGADNTISTLKTNSKAFESGIDDFLTEAERLNRQKVSHPNIVAIDDVFKANNTAYYTMEYVEGKNLRQYIKKNGRPLTVEQALSVMRPVLKAVATLHRNKITHLDIKHDNIILSITEDGAMRPVLIDFGQSKHYDKKGNATSKLTNAGCSEGFAPQEQYLGLTSFTPQADIYALCATLLYLLTGKQPEKSSEMSATKIDAMLGADIPQNIREAIIKGMRNNKDDRTQSIAQLADDLGIDITEEEGTDGNVTRLLNLDSGKTIGIKKLSGFDYHKLLKPGIAIAALLVVAGGVLWWVNRSSTSESEQIAEVVIDTTVEEEGGTDSSVTPVEETSSPEVKEEAVAANPAEETKPEETKKEEKQKQEEEKKDNKEKQEDKPKVESLDDLFAKASSTADFKALADKGYAKAYAPLAEKYFAAHNYGGANTYARRALSSGVGRQQAINVIEKLDVIGFYDNGENGGKPKY